MKSSVGFLAVLFLSLFLFLGIACNKTPLSSDVVIYSYVNPIVNPPDTFKVAYNLSQIGNRTAFITFQDSAVWKIQILTQSRMTFGFLNPADNSMVYIDSPDTVGLRGSIEYSFIATNSTGDSTLTKGPCYVEFTKLPLDYSSFHKRY